MSSPPNAANKARRAGFALIEVMVAVAVAALIMGALIRAFSTTWSGVVAVREEAEVMLLARSILDSDPVSRQLTSGVKTGTIGRYAWTLTTARMPAIAAAVAKNETGEQPVNPWALYRVVVVMNAPSGRSTTVETFQLAQSKQ